MRMSFPLLASLGVRLEKENLYNNLLAAVKEKNLGRDVITNQFVSEISDAMGKRAQGHSVQTSGLMTAKQACHILALMVDQVKFPSEDSITKQIRTQLWHKRDLDKLKGMLKEGLVQPGNPWPILEKVLYICCAAPQDIGSMVIMHKMPRKKIPNRHFIFYL